MSFGHDVLGPESRQTPALTAKPCAAAGYYPTGYEAYYGYDPNAYAAYDPNAYAAYAQQAAQPPAAPAPQPAVAASAPATTPAEATPATGITPSVDFPCCSTEACLKCSSYDVCSSLSTWSTGRSSGNSNMPVHQEQDTRV